MVPGISLYNQTTLSDDDFVTNFVARHDKLDALIRRLRTTTSDAGAHQILIGQRGMGKTSLLRRVAIEISRDHELAARFIALNFREEQYNVLKLDDFWRNCGEALAEWAEATGDAAFAGRLDAALLTVTWSDGHAGDQFRKEMTALGRRAVLLVDNLDLIINALPDKDRWTLRRFLQERDGPILIGAATQGLAQGADPKAAFYEFFQPDYLEPLDAVATEACMRTIAAGRGEEGRHVLDVLARQPGRLKTLHNLTGGNPRVLALIYRLLETDETGAAMADLEVLLDQVTPYYKARVEEYQTPLQRAVIDGIALHWDPISSADLVKATNVLATTLSGQLARLRNDHLIEQVNTSGSYSGYQLVERFFNIWYLMRHGTRRTKQKMRWLVEFLSSLYSSLELNEIVRRAELKGTNKAWRSDYAAAVEEALARCGTADRKHPEILAVKNHAVQPDAALISMAEQSRQAWQDKNYQAALEITDQLIEASKSLLEEQRPLSYLQLLFNRALLVGALSGADAELAAYDLILAAGVGEANGNDRAVLASTLFNKSLVIGQTMGLKEEDAILEELIGRFDGDEDPAVAAEVRKGIASLAINYRIEGRLEEALALSEELVRRCREIGTGPEHAHALVTRARTLLKMQRAVEALAVVDELVQQYGKSADEDIRFFVADALLGRVMALASMADFTQARVEVDAMIDSYRSAQSVGIMRLVSRGRAMRASLRETVGDVEGAILDLRLAIEEARAGPAVIDRLDLASLMLNYANATNLAGDTTLAVQRYDELIAEFGSDKDTPLVDVVGDALIKKAIAIGESGDVAGEIAIYDGMIERFDNASPIVLQIHLAHAFYNKALTLIDNPPAAITTYDALISRFHDTTDDILLVCLADSMINRAILLSETGDVPASLRACDEVVERFGSSDLDVLRQKSAWALVNKAVTYHISGQPTLEIAAYRDLLARYGTEGSEFSSVLFKCRVFLARSLEEENELEGAIELYEAALAQVDKDDAPINAEEELLAARIRLASLVENDVEYAKRLYSKVAETEPTLGTANLAWMMLLNGDVDGACELRSALNDLPTLGAALLDAGIELARGNFGLATALLRPALEENIESGTFNFVDDIGRLLRLVVQYGFGERLTRWLEETALADRVAPVYAALGAAIRGDSALRDVSPEVREPAITLLGRRARRSRAGP